MTITFGLWLLPVVITLASAVWATKTLPSSAGTYGSNVMFGVLVLAAATIVSLVAWLAYALALLVLA